VIDLATAAPLVLPEAEHLQWDMLSLLQSHQEEVSLDTAAEIVAALVSMLGSGEDGLPDGLPTEEAPQGNGQHNQGMAGTLSIGGAQMLLPLAQVRLLAPLPRPSSLRVFTSFGEDTEPSFIFGNQGAIIGPDTDVPLPGYGQQPLHADVEIACIIGQQGRDIAYDEAAEMIAGYMLAIEWRAWETRLEERWSSSKQARDYVTSLGPWLVTPDELEIYTEDDGHLSLTIQAQVNSKMVLRENTSLMRYSFAAMIAYASQDVTLYPGDVFLSGRIHLDAGAALQPGDVVELEATGLGLLRNRII
jgi:fumarylacetoacetate (FAA) hydrolase